MPTKRRLIQLYAALLFNANIKGFFSGKMYRGKLKNLCAPGINCYSCPGASAACPLGALQNSLAESSARAPYYVFGIILLYGLLFGRWICGYLCPFGLIQDLLHKIKTPKVKKSRVTRALSYLKYVILAVFVLILPLIYLSPTFCKYICPAGVVEGAFGLLSHPDNEGLFGSLGPLFTWKFAVMVAIIVGAVFIYRIFCRFLCPLGALYGLFNKIALVGIKLDRGSCISCGRCLSTCKVDIRHVGDQECINCGECIDVCPTKAISWKGSKWVLAPNEVSGDTLSEDEAKATELRNQRIKKRNRIVKIVVGVLMAVLLGGAIVYYNFIDRDAVYESGCDVGDQCYAYDIPLYNEDEGAVYNIENEKSKVVIINFWATWCSGCVAELPHFDEVAKEYGDKVSVIAIHSSYKTTDVQEYLDTKTDNDGKPWSEYIIAFGQDDGDTANSIYFNKLGGVDSYPITLVLDREGVVVAKFEGGVTYETLVKAVEEALAKR